MTLPFSAFPALSPSVSALSAFPASAWNYAARACRSLERLVLPNACVACDRLMDGTDADALVCGRCRLRLKPLLGGCPRCRQPLPLIGACRFCAGWPAELVWARSAVWLDPEARRVVHHLKYSGLARLAPFLAGTIVRHVARPSGALALVPVPASGRRVRERGYNQAALIARALGEVWSIPVREELLTRRRDAGSQTALTPEERLANVAGVFAAAPARRSHTARTAETAGEGTGGALAVVIIVDDVLTTGATLCAAARELVAAGWPRVAAITFARALPVERRMT
jgi:predicted amidophosphoribosyltransferase